MEGKCIVVIDPVYGAKDLFVGHPVTAGARELAIHVKCKTDPDWTLFRFDKKVTGPLGQSVVFMVTVLSPG